MADMEDLELAVQKGDVKKARAIVQANPSLVNAQMYETYTQDGWTPINTAAWYGQAEIVGLLLQHGANPDTANPVSQHLPLLFVVFLKLAILRSCFLSLQQPPPKKQQQPEETNKKQFGSSVLHIGAMRGNTEIVRLLLSHRARINRTDDNGWTPIHAAVHNAQVDVIKLLLQHGADVNAINNNGRTPRGVAVVLGHKHVVELLDQEMRRRLKAFLLGTLRRKVKQPASKKHRHKVKHCMVLMLPVDVLGMVATFVMRN
eukprot:c18819_g1_i4.p1 GENE.c18819_g1_i4~~c18819_g1_i4.p1  ORF type:complete len:278 (+),score=38.82 c18819_g1_i4:60-836(+)